MSQTETAGVIGTTICRETGKPMNCNSWATYEAPNSSPTAGFCNGGTVDSDFWLPCPSKEECRVATNQRRLNNGRSLPVVGQPTSQIRYVGGRPAGGLQAPTYGSVSPPTTIPQQRPMAPTPLVVVPSNNNPFLDTPRSGQHSDHSPTYLPHPEEHPARRLFANMLIGSMESAAHHVSSFLRNVDIFPFKKGNPK